jgi:hypothetical protein
MKLRDRFLNAVVGVGAALALPILGIAFMLGTKTNAGLDLEWTEAIGVAAGFTGTATATSATSLTATGTPFTSNQYQWMTVFAGSAYGLILSNTTSVLTVDRWYNPASPGGTAATTPGATSVYVIMPASPPSQFMGLTASGGLIRKQATLSHSAGGSTGTIVGVFTANGSDSLPVTIAKMGVGPSLLSSANQLFQTVLNATATITVSGDQVTVTDTVTT